MKITLAVPEGKNFTSRLRKELSLAKNIKDKHTRDGIIKGLSKIEQCLSDNKVFLYDSENDTLEIHNYPLNEFIYHCGTDYKLPKDIPDFKKKYLVVTLDANEATIGLTSGSHGDVKILFNEKSFVPRKHDAGGQSQIRFERNRQLALNAWLKKVGDKLKELYYEGEKK